MGGPLWGLANSLLIERRLIDLIDSFYVLAPIVCTRTQFSINRELLYLPTQLAKHWKALLKKEGKAAAKEGYVPPAKGQRLVWNVKLRHCED